MSEIEDIAKDLVALWESPNIRGLPRAERNAAIEETRNRMIEAIHARERAMTDDLKRFAEVGAEFLRLREEMLALADKLGIPHEEIRVSGAVGNEFPDADEALSQVHP